MYEKKMVENSGGPEAGACSFCLRPKSIVICSGCRTIIPNVRRRTTCSVHPREFFLMDIPMCRTCKGKNLLEVGLDDIPNDLLAVLTPPASPATPTSSTSFGLATPSPPPVSNNRRGLHAPSGLSPINENLNPVESMDVVEPNVASSAPLQPRNVGSTPGSLVPGRGRGLKRQRVSIAQIQAAASAGNTQGAVAVNPVVPVASPSSAHALPSVNAPEFVPISVGNGGSCVCTRQVDFLVCTICGYYAEGVRKYIPCPAHPNEKKGIKFCPECGAVGENLDETSV